tara:strand:- start:4990 stop:5370 length:381 start_codon:yes stop_codon:yes gene_type:complete
LLLLSSKWAFDGVIAFQQRGESPQFILDQIPSLYLRIDTCLLAEISRGPGAYTEEVGQRNHGRFVIGDIYTQQTRHLVVSSILFILLAGQWGNSALPLLVPGITADHIDAALAAHDLTVSTDPLHT